MAPISVGRESGPGENIPLSRDIPDVIHSLGQPGDTVPVASQTDYFRPATEAM